MRTADEIDILEMKVRGLERELHDMRETLRDKFAMAALPSVVSDYDRCPSFDVGVRAYQIADAMLAARTNQPTPKETHVPAAP